MPAQAQETDLGRHILLEGEPLGKTVDAYRLTSLSHSKTSTATNAFLEHTMSLKQVTAMHQADISREDPSASKGLSALDAAQRLREQGLNRLTPPPKPSALKKYLKCLCSIFNLMLLFSGIMEFLLLKLDFADYKSSEWIGPILVLVAFLNAFIEWFQERRATAIVTAFLADVPFTCRVIRDGRVLSIDTKTLVRGDVVHVRTGDKVPADLYLIQASDLKVDNSTLTGESRPQARLALLQGEERRAEEARNMLFTSTVIVSGEGMGVVVRTGDSSMIGSLAKLTNDEKRKPSPLSQEVQHFVKIISVIAILSSLVFLIIGFTVTYRHHGSSMLIFAVSILVAWIPEGLSATIVMLLSISAGRLAKEKVLVKNLQGVETLGALTMLCTDKTGTLTQNKMTVSYLATPTSLISASSALPESGCLPFQINQTGVSDLLLMCALCSHTKMDHLGTAFENRKIFGDATEIGLVQFAGKHLPYDLTRAKNREVFSIPFNSANKYSVTIIERAHRDGHLTLFMKGAPERIFARCSTVLINGEAVTLKEEHQAFYQSAYQSMASRGQRIIGFAQRLLPASDFSKDSFTNQADLADSLTADLCFVGLIGLEDLPKEGVKESIAALKRAGIAVVMITGDHPDSAESMARRVGLIEGETRQSLARRDGLRPEDIKEAETDAIVVHGQDIEGMKDADWDAVFSKKEIIFARTSPKDKLEVVKRAQAQGHVVGVTGDGSNDSAALKKADLGISMNHSGADASKEAADMILMDDNFSSIVTGIKAGRQVFINLKRSIQYTTSHSVPEILPQVLYVLVPIPLPISPILILAIDLGFEMLAALSFAWDQPEDEARLMSARPRRPVTERSKMLLKRKTMRQEYASQLGIDQESVQKKRPAVFRRVGRAITKPVRDVLSRRWWSEKFQSTENESLVDASLLSYSYLQVGLIQAITSLVAYFLSFQRNGFSARELRNLQMEGVYFLPTSPSYTTLGGQIKTAAQQMDALAQAQSIVLISIFLCQCFNLYAVKSNYRLPFGRSIIANPYSFICLLFGAVLIGMIVYLPGLRVVFGTSHRTDPLLWTVGLVGGLVILVFASLRVLVRRVL